MTATESIVKLCSNIVKAEAAGLAWAAHGLTLFSTDSYPQTRACRYDLNSLALDMKRAENLGVYWFVTTRQEPARVVDPSLVADQQAVWADGDPASALCKALNIIQLRRVRQQAGLSPRYR